MLTKDSAHKKDLRTGLSDMQHRHFATVATIIRGLPDAFGNRGEIAKWFATELATTNPRFDRRRFLLACGVNAE
jgi:hypothetical protein